MAGFRGKFKVHWKCLDVKKYKEDSETGYIEVTAQSHNDARDIFLKYNPNGYEVLDVTDDTGNKKTFIKEGTLYGRTGEISSILEGLNRNRKEA